MEQQLNLFSFSTPTFKIDKPIRLIEMFAGIGSQAKALKNLGANFKHWKIVEFDRHAVDSYNAVHGTNFEVKDITQTHAEDLEIVERERVPIHNATKQGYLYAEQGDGIDIGGRMKFHRGTVQKEMSQTIKTSIDIGVIDGKRIRRLTSKECWMLMGFSSEDHEKARKVNTESQLYKQAGNSIVVNVLMAIFQEML